MTKKLVSTDIYATSHHKQGIGNFKIRKVLLIITFSCSHTKGKQRNPLTPLNIKTQ